MFWRPCIIHANVDEKHKINVSTFKANSESKVRDADAQFLWYCPSSTAKASRTPSALTSTTRCWPHCTSLAT